MESIGRENICVSDPIVHAAAVCMYESMAKSVVSGCNGLVS